MRQANAEGPTDFQAGNQRWVQRFEQILARLTRCLITNQTTGRGTYEAVWISALVTLSLMLGAAMAFEQPGAARQVVAHIEGTVLIDGQRLDTSASPFPLRQNSVVRTESGRAEIRLTAGDTVFLGENASMRVNDSRSLNLGRFEVLAGSAVVITGHLGPAVACEEEVTLSDSGIFRFDVHPVGGEKFCQVRVYRGAAAAPMPSFIWVLTTGKLIDLNRRCGDHIPRNEFNVEDADHLDRWSRQRMAIPEYDIRTIGLGHQEVNEIRSLQ